MTAQLSVIPDELPELRAAAIERADNAAALATLLASSLRCGGSGKELRDAALAVARGSVGLAEALVELLESTGL
jgi:hypothetical protein